MYPNVDISNWPNFDIEITHDYDTTTRRSQHTTSIDSDAIFNDSEDTISGTNVVGHVTNLEDTNLSNGDVDHVTDFETTCFFGVIDFEDETFSAKADFVTDVGVDVANVVNNSEHHFDICGVTFTDSYYLKMGPLARHI